MVTTIKNYLSEEVMEHHKKLYGDFAIFRKDSCYFGVEISEKGILDLVYNELHKISSLNIEQTFNELYGDSGIIYAISYEDYEYLKDIVNPEFFKVLRVKK